jgi:hypothetical protein
MRVSMAAAQLPAALPKKRRNPRRLNAIPPRLSEHSAQLPGLRMIMVMGPADRPRPKNATTVTTGSLARNGARNGKLQVVSKSTTLLRRAHMGGNWVPVDALQRSQYSHVRSSIARSSGRLTRRRTDAIPMTFLGHGQCATRGPRCHFTPKATHLTVKL